MRKLLGGIILLTLIIVGGFIWQENQMQSQAAYNPKNLVRFHVIANSDLPKDQKLKNEIRDILLAELNTDLGRTEEKTELKSAIGKKLAEIELMAENHLRINGVEDKVKAEFGEFPFPIKGYGPLVLPAGDYEALKVVIGEGQGSNWWCVLFPPLCFVNITESTPDEESLDKILAKAKIEEPIERPTEIKFKLKIANLFK